MDRFIGGRVWPDITKASKNRSGRGWIAVPYFSRGAVGKLHLRSGDVLVVNASKRAVESGQTHPESLLRLIRRGISVYSNESLHAKVYVFGRSALVGSANASASSSETLTEAMILTTRTKVVSVARSFVAEACLHPLTATVVERLATFYRPPRKSHRSKSRRGRQSPRAWIELMELSEPPREVATAMRNGNGVANRKRKSKLLKLDRYWWPGKCPHRVGDIIYQIQEGPRGGQLFNPPGRVVHRVVCATKRGRQSIVFLEMSPGRPLPLARVSKSLPRTRRSILGRAGLVRDVGNRALLAKLWLGRR
jgi:hypothetical protein